MMSCCHDWNFCNCWNHSFCPFPQWKHPLLCNPAHFCCADQNNDNGPTLVIHQILLEPCGNQSCTPRNFTIRVTGPSYPCGETFTIRAGSCTELDEPLVITNLEPGQYEIDLITAGSNCGHGCGCGCGCGHEYDSTITGPISGGCVSITNSRVPTVLTIVSRKRFTRRRCRRHWGSSWDWTNNCNSSRNCNNNCSHTC